jgi:hypothetical protein
MSLRNEVVTRNAQQLRKRLGFYGHKNTGTDVHVSSATADNVGVYIVHQTSQLVDDIF